MPRPRSPQPGRGRRPRRSAWRRSPSASRRRSGARCPSSSISPVAATLRPRSTLPRSSSTMSSANASPAEGPPTPARSIVDVDGQLDVGELLDLDPDDRPALLGRARDRPDLDHLRRAVARGRGAAPSRRACASRSAGAGRPASAPACRRRRRSTSVGWILPSAGASGATADDQRALRLRLDLVAELAQRDRGCDLLRAVHLPGGSGGGARRSSTPAARAPARGRGRRRRAGPPRRASRAATPRGRPRRRSRSRRAGAASRPATLTLSASGLARVGQEQVAVGRQQPQRADRRARRGRARRSTSRPGFTASSASGRRRRRSPRRSRTRRGRRRGSRRRRPISRGVPRRRERDRGEVGLGRPVRIDLPDPFRVDAAGGDGVDRDPLRAELARRRLQPADEPGPDGAREREPVDRLLDRARRDRDHAAVAARLEVREAEAHEPDRREQQAARRRPRAARR